MTNYYSDQMARLTDKTTVNVHFSDFSGNATKHMQVNLESVDVFINFLKSEKKRMLKEVKDSEEMLKTEVIFKIEGAEVFAIMPYKIADPNGNITSYSHVGQHSAANIDYVKRLYNATPEEYSALKEEMESIGYNLKLIKSINTTKWANVYINFMKNLKKQ
jgi:hypothetical protein